MQRMGETYMKTNYHTHNRRCNHAAGTIEDYIKVAIEEKFDEIGISDHLPHPGKTIDTPFRMKYEEVSEYFKEINDVIEKYGDKISIKKAIECEYFDDFGWLYNELKEKYKVDYLLLGVHFFPYKGQWHYVGAVNLDEDMLEAYVDHAVESMKAGIFKYIAHPDLFGVSYRDWNEHSIKQARRILETAEEMDLPIEININGFNRGTMEYNNGIRYPYPIKEFWELSKEYDVKRILGIDAHSPEHMRDLEKGLNFAKELDLEIIDRLEL